MLVTLAVAVLLSLPCFFFIRHGILGIFRISIFDQGRHQLAHVIAVAFEPPEFHLQGQEAAILLQHQDCRAGIHLIR